MSKKNKCDKIIEILKNHSDYLSTDKLANELNITTNEVSEKIKTLIEKGFNIESRPKIGFRLTRQSDKLNPENIKNNINTEIIGNTIIYYEKINSTNTVANELATNEAADGTVVIADEQTNGRGRLNRNWISTARKNILMTLILRPPVRPSNVFSLTMLSSVAIVKAIKRITSLDTQIKWPNDIYYKNKKLCGILTELNAKHDKINFAIVGIGINVNFEPHKYPEISDIATSIYQETGKNVSREKLLKAILQEIDASYKLLKNNGIHKIRNDWNVNSMVLGKQVKVTSINNIEEGIVESVAENGSLILVDKNGNKKNILCGDVSLRLKN